MKSKTISIIVPIYNVEKYLDACVKSIIDQTYSDLEIILVDDGSEDGCSSICDKWALLDSRIKVIHQKNQGLSATRNVGIDIAQGEYLYFVDSDDYIALDLCAKVVQAFEASGADIVAFNFYNVEESGLISLPKHKQPCGILTTYEAIDQLIRDNLRVHAWGKMYKRELFSMIRFPVGYHCEDIGTTHKLFYCQMLYMF